MGFSLRRIADNIKFPEAVSLNALEQVITQATVEAVVADLGVEEERMRKLPAVVTLWLCIAMGLFTNTALEQVLKKMVKGVRYIWPGDADYETANKSAICQARYRLGAQPVVELFHRVCKPMATEQTIGAFLFGLRLMAMLKMFATPRPTSPFSVAVAADEAMLPFHRHVRCIYVK